MRGLTTAGADGPPPLFGRSVQGPWLITLSTGLMVGLLGPLYGTLFGLRVTDYLPHVALGLVV